mmetsp:Transcript_65460/g.133150  ORF Transcript_65460/g.133150 Transcript_65460/m.133150 type:complete len:154 (+) Transcript_65460:1-462(+)
MEGDPSQWYLWICHESHNPPYRAASSGSAAMSEKGVVLKKVDLLEKRFGQLLHKMDQLQANIMTAGRSDAGPAAGATVESVHFNSTGRLTLVSSAVTSQPSALNPAYVSTGAVETPTVLGEAAPPDSTPPTLQYGWTLAPTSEGNEDDQEESV